MKSTIKNILKLIKEYSFELKTGIISLAVLELVNFLVIKVALSKGEIISNKTCLVASLATFTGWLIAFIIEVTILHQKESLDQKL